MSTTIGILSIVVAFAALIVLTYKGMSVMYVAPLCALFVAIVNGIPLLDAITGPFLGGTTGHDVHVVWTLAASVVAAILFAIFPSLA